MQGERNVYKIDKGLARATIRAVFAFSTSGKMYQPMLIYSLEIITSEITHREFKMTAARYKRTF